MTHFPVCALRSVDLDTPDLAASEAFYTHVWGLQVAARADGVVYLRATGDDHHVLALHAAMANGLRSATFRTQAASDLANIAGGQLVASDIAGGTTVALRESGGLLMRFVHGDSRHADASLVANMPCRLAHLNINSTDVDFTIHFYETVLGFRLADRSKIMAFVRCNADHHTVVIAEAPVHGLNHIAFLMPDLESVMRGAGRLVDHGYPIGWGVGRHGPGDNVFAYFLDPHGVVVEYTAEVLQVDDTYRVRGPSEWTWPPGRTDHWGIAPPKPDHVKHAQLATPFV